MKLKSRFLGPIVNIVIVLVILGSLNRAAGKPETKIITKRINPAVKENIEAIQAYYEYMLKYQERMPKMLDEEEVLSNKSNGENVEISHCRKNDTIVRNVCSEYCIQMKHYDEGKCSQDESACICSTDGAAPIKVKLFSPQSSGKVSQSKGIFPAKSSKMSVTQIGKMPCNHSPVAKSICRVFCETKEIFYSECSSDQNSCLCLTFQNTKSSRKQREMADGIEETIIMTPPPVVSIVADSIRKRMRPMRRRLVNGPSSPVQPLLGCNPFSCYNNCPRHCDSLCTANLQCFCSCPEDEMSFDYFDPGYGPRPGMFFNY